MNRETSRMEEDCPAILNFIFLRLSYKGNPFKRKYKPDFIGHDKIIVDLKVVKQTTTGDEVQICNYLKVTKLKLGFLVKFGVHPKLMPKGLFSNHKRN